MSEHITTVTKSITSASEGQLEPTFILGELRRLVKEVKQEDPALADAKLFDLSFVSGEEGLDVRMFFTQVN